MATHVGGSVALQVQSLYVDGMHTARLWAPGVVVLTASAVAALLTNRSMSGSESTAEIAEPAQEDPQRMSRPAFQTSSTTSFADET